jgi:hypothetical protein
VKQWIKVATRSDVVTRGVKVGALVGTILVAINQGDLILSDGLSAADGWKIVLTYLVPYCVSTYAGVSAIIAHEKVSGGVRGISGDE